MDKIEFKVGDIIIYYGSDCKNETGRPQKIVDKDRLSYHTIFLDDEKDNSFGIISNYSNDSILASDAYMILGNGVPLIWGDVI